MISDRIHHELSRLNYFTQIRLFRQFLQDQRIGGFLVHGQPGYGQVHLVRRFLNAVPSGTAMPLIQFYLSRRAIRTDIKAPWRELGRQLQLDRLSDRAEIARQTIAQLKTQHVVLVFHDLDCIEADYLDELTREFWIPLAELAHPSIPIGHEFYLLMFLLDQEGCTNSWEMAFAEQFDEVWHPRQPLRLPVIEPLCDRVLISWMENAIDTFPVGVTQKLKQTVQVILEKTDGVPERVFEQVFSLYECSWKQEEKRWQEL